MREQLILGESRTTEAITKSIQIFSVFPAA